MSIEELRQLLDIFPENAEVYIRTIPGDYSQPIRTRHLSILELPKEAVKLLITAYHPEEAAS